MLRGRSRCRARGWAADGTGPLVAVAASVAGHGLWGVGFGRRGRAGSLVGAPEPQSSGSVVVVCRLGPSCSAVCGIFLNPDQTCVSCAGGNDSSRLSHRRSLSGLSCKDTSPAQRTLPVAPSHLPKALPAGVTPGVWFPPVNWWRIRTCSLQQFAPIILLKGLTSKITLNTGTHSFVLVSSYQ